MYTTIDLVINKTNMQLRSGANKNPYSQSRTAKHAESVPFYFVSYISIRCTPEMVTKSRWSGQRSADNEYRWRSAAPSLQLFCVLMQFQLWGKRRSAPTGDQYLWGSLSYRFSPLCTSTGRSTAAKQCRNIRSNFLIFIKMITFDYKTMRE